jgi:hypothetical protein
VKQEGAKKLCLGAVLSLFCYNQVLAQQGNPLPVPTAVVPRTNSSTDVYSRESAFKKKYTEETEKRRRLEDEIAKIRARFGSEKTSTPALVASPAAIPVAQDVSSAPRQQEKKGSKSKASSRTKASAVRLPVVTRQENTGAVFQAQRVMEQNSQSQLGSPLIFAVSETALTKEISTVIPLGSYVKARVLTGVEANTLEPYPMLLQLDYAFIGPNKTKIDLSHCFMMAKTKANLSTERVLGETQEISCVRDNGEHFKRPAKGYLAGEDSTFGLTGQLISKQGQVLLAAVLANLAKGAGEAVAMANSTTKIVTGPGGAIEKSTSITGSTAGFIAGRATVDSAQLIAQWYLDYARQLVPSIAVGSGRDIWIVLLDTIQVPPLPSNMEERG